MSYIRWNEENDFYMFPSEGGVMENLEEWVKDAGAEYGETKRRDC